MLELLLALLALMRAAVRDRGELVAENVLLRQQRAVLTRPRRSRPRLRTCDKLAWVLVRAVCRDWRRHLLLVRPETVIDWRRQGRRLFWGGRSRGRPGRPRLAAETRALIARMARENPAWGSERIRGELLKLGIAVSKRSVQRYRQRGPARPPRQTWRTFLANHAAQIWAAGPSTGADADLSAAARDRDPERLRPAATDGSYAPATEAAHLQRPSRPRLAPRVRRLDCVGGPRGAAAAGASTRCGRQPPARARAPTAGVRRSSDRRPRAAAARPARRVRRVLRPRAPPPYALLGASQAAGRLTIGPIRVRPGVGGLPHTSKWAA